MAGPLPSASTRTAAAPEAASQRLTLAAARRQPPVASRPHLSPHPHPPEPAGRLGRETLADRLAETLCGQIHSGQLEPGDRLPTEARLAAAHGVSRSVVREALHRVKSRGLVVARQGSGVFVAAPAPHRALVFDPAVLDSPGAVVQVVEVRRVLESGMAALAAERATRAQVAALRRALAAIDAAAAAGRDGVAEDLAFHRTIGEATGNPQFSRLLGFLEQYLHEGLRAARSDAGRRDGGVSDAVRSEHQRIVDAIAARDVAGARRAATRHLLMAARRLGQPA